ncbi:MAG TPA: DUF305 domain-containing protein [Paraburkholderia sp.]|nr:DUF305 domain-containing protein [Paraburkholderia sp.]
MKNLSVLRAAFLCASLISAMAALPASAQQGESMPGMDMSASTDAGSSPSTSAFEKADKEMMTKMSAPSYTGDTDKDFVSHMIPHHQGAIEMAKVELKYGKDPELKRLAKNIIKAQHDEIGFMQRWQAKHSGK